MSKVSTIILIFILTSAQTGLANNMETLMDKTGLDIQFKDCQRYRSSLRKCVSLQILLKDQKKRYGLYYLPYPKI